GQAGGGLFNVTIKSGTNGYHGTAYEYFVNEDLNAAFPFSNDGSGHKIRPRNRRNDYGGTLGGPVFIPKLYTGHSPRRRRPHPGVPLPPRAPPGHVCWARALPAHAGPATARGGGGSAASHP